jgi:hypothetical protein
MRLALAAFVAFLSQRSDQMSEAATPNITLNRSAQKLRFWVPASLRAAAPG